MDDCAFILENYQKTDVSTIPKSDYRRELLVFMKTLNKIEQKYWRKIADKFDKQHRVQTKPNIPEPEAHHQSKISKLAESLPKASNPTKKTDKETIEVERER